MWTPPAVMPAASIRIESTTYSVLNDQSDGTFQVTQASSIAGTITTSGAPLSGILVQIFEGTTLRFTTNTDAAGVYGIGGLPPATYRIQPADPGFSFTPGAKGDTVVLAAGAAESGWDFTAGLISRFIILNSPLDGDEIMPNVDTQVQFFAQDIATDATPKVQIEYSLDGGTNWTQLESSWPSASDVAQGTNIYLWQAADKPDTTAAQLAGVKLRISSLTGPVVSGQSFAGFTILRIAHLTGTITAGTLAKPFNDVSLSFLGSNPPAPVTLTGTNIYDVIDTQAFVDGSYQVTATKLGWSFTPVPPTTVTFIGGTDQVLNFNGTPTTASIIVDLPDGTTKFPNLSTAIQFTTADLTQLGNTDIDLDWWDGAAWNYIGTYTVLADGIQTFSGWFTPNPITAPMLGQKIRATSVDWPSYTAESAAFTVTNVPPDPTNLGATATVSTIDLAWDDNAANETGFEIERSLDDVTYLPLTTVGIDATAYTDTVVVPGTLYYYRVRAITSVTQSGYSNVDSARPELFTPLTAAGFEKVQRSDVEWGDYDNDGDLDRLQRQHYLQALPE